MQLIKISFPSDQGHDLKISQQIILVIEIKILKRNVSNKERVIRILGAIALIVLDLIGAVGFPENILIWLVAMILLLTALTGHCPVYILFGVNTYSRKKEFKGYH